MDRLTLVDRVYRSCFTSNEHGENFDPYSAVPITDEIVHLCESVLTVVHHLVSHTGVLRRPSDVFELTSCHHEDAALHVGPVKSLGPTDDICVSRLTFVCYDTNCCSIVCHTLGSAVDYWPSHEEGE